MIHLGFEELEKEPRKAMALCSSAMRDAIRRYGYAAVLDLMVRISIYDPIVNDSLPFFPSIASAEMLAALSTGPSSKIGAKNPNNPGSETEPLIILAGRNAGK